MNLHTRSSSLFLNNKFTLGEVKFIICSLLAAGFFSKGHLDARAYTSV